MPARSFRRCRATDRRRKCWPGRCASSRSAALRRSRVPYWGFEPAADDGQDAEAQRTTAAIAAWEDTVPYFPATAPAGTCTRLFGVGSPACRQVKSESAGMSSPLRGPERTSDASGEENQPKKVFQGEHRPPALKMPQSMSESTRARTSAGKKQRVAPSVTLADQPSISR